MKNPAIDISLASPFPVDDFPVLHTWIKRAREARMPVFDDDAPTEMRAFVDWQAERTAEPEMITWAVQRDGELAGYIEATTDELNPDPLKALKEIWRMAFVVCCFKREMWKPSLRMRALNLVLGELFDDGIGVALFPVFDHAQWLASDLREIGGHLMGQTEPRMIHGVETPVEMWAITAQDWRASKSQIVGGIEGRRAAQEPETRELEALGV